MLEDGKTSWNAYYQFIIACCLQGGDNIIVIVCHFCLSPKYLNNGSIYVVSKGKLGEYLNLSSIWKSSDSLSEWRQISDKTDLMTVLTYGESLRP